MTLKYGREGQIDTDASLASVLDATGEAANFIPWGGLWANELVGSDGMYRFLKGGQALGRGAGNSLDAVLADNCTVLVLSKVMKPTNYSAVVTKLLAGTTVGFYLQCRPVNVAFGNVYVRSDYVVGGNQPVAAHALPDGKEQDRQWHWIGFSRTNGTSYKAYQDGAVSTSSGTAGSWQNTENLQILTNSGTFAIAAVLIFNRVLTDVEAQQVQRGQVAPLSVPGLVGYYKFNETHGNASGQCTDYSGAGNHLTYSGAVWETYDPASTAQSNFANGQPYVAPMLSDQAQWYNRVPNSIARADAQGCVFNRGAAVYVPYNALMNLTGDLSYGGWVRVERFRAGQQSLTLLPAQYVTTSGPINIGINTGGKQVAVTLGNTAAQTVSTFVLVKPFPFGKFTHVFVTLSGTALSLYLNGVLVGTATNAQAHGANPGTDWALGEDSSGHMKWRSIRLFSRAISAAEVEQMFQTDTCLDRTGLVGEWLANNPHENIVRDTSGNGLNSNTHGQLRLIDSPYSAPRKKRYGTQFRALANSQYVGGNCAAVNGLSAITVSGWRKNLNVPVFTNSRFGPIFSSGLAIVTITGNSGKYVSAFIRSVTGDASHNIDFGIHGRDGAGDWKLWSVSVDYVAKLAKAYLNGVKVVESALPGGFQSAISGTGTPSIVAGNYGADDSRCIFDAVRVHNRVLTDVEQRDLYLESNIPRNGLIAEYLFDNDTVPTTSFDTSGNGYHLTGSGTVSANWVKAL